MSSSRPGPWLLILLVTLALGLAVPGPDASAEEVLLVSEFSGKLLFLDAAAPDPTDAVIASVPLAATNARAVAASPNGALAFVAHNPPAGPSFVSVVSVAAVLGDTSPANDVLATIPIPRTPSLGGQNLSGITELGVSPDSLRLAVSLLPPNAPAQNGLVYLIDLDPGSGSYLTIVDFQSLNGNINRPTFRSGSPELWISNALGVGTSNAAPAFHVRDAMTLDAFVPSRNIANFGPAEAFAAPLGAQFDTAGAFAVVPAGFNGYVNVFNAATRVHLAAAKFGTAPCANYGTSFPHSASLSPDATRIVTTLGGSRPFNFGCGPLSSAVHGIGFVDFNPATALLDNVGTLALAPATDGGVLISSDVRFSLADPTRAFVLTSRGVHKVDVGARSKLAHLRLGFCTGEGAQDLDSVSVPVGAPRRVAAYRDLDGDGIADTRCDPNAPPVADAGPDQSVGEGVLVTLDGSASADPNGTALAYQWSQLLGPAVALSSTTAAMPSFTAPDVGLAGAVLTFQLVVSDGSFPSAPDTVQVTINYLNQAPVASAGPDQTASEGQLVQLDGSASSDGDGNPLSFAWVQIGGPPVTLSDAGVATPSFTAPAVATNGTPQTLAFELTVGDGFTVAIDRVEIAVVNVNQPPAAQAGDAQTVSEGALVVLAGAGSDPDGDSPLGFQWLQIAGPPVPLSGDTTAAATFTAPPVTTNGAFLVLTFQLVVNDGFVDSAPATVDVTVRNVNQPPVADAGDAQTVQEGAPVALSGGASFDPDADGITFAWTQEGGPAVVLSGADTPSPSFVAPPVGVAGETLTFRLVVTDALGAAADESVEIVVTHVNQRPEADAGEAQTVNEGAAAGLDGAGSSDPENGPLSYQWTQVGGPAVTLLDATTATPSFVAPAVAATTPLSFQLVVSDGELESEPALTTVTVLDTSQALACDAAFARPRLLWPPSHQLARVRIKGVTDAQHHRVRITITGVTQDEPVSGPGFGRTDPDALIRGGRLYLRAERYERNGRVYEVRFRADDGRGGTCEGAVQVGVPHRLKRGHEPVDDGQMHDSTQGDHHHHHGHHHHDHGGDDD
jgi:hypothetical protein